VAVTIALVPIQKPRLAGRTATIRYFSMAINTETLKALVENELVRIADTRVTTHIRSLLIEPRPVLRDWDYGVKGQQFVCWNALKHGASNTGIAYCESGFGPQTPWGLVVLEGPHMSMGMDSGWFRTLLGANFESFAATELPIWRVFKTDPSGFWGSPAHNTRRRLG
jgi:hypothetical protein